MLRSECTNQPIPSQSLSEEITLFTVIIPCQEDDILLGPTLNSILQNSFPAADFEVLVFHSSRARVRVSKSILKNFPVYEYSSSFETQAEALNLGITKARGNIICLTKPGCIVAPDWFVEIDNFLRSNPSIDGTGGPVSPCLNVGTKLQTLASTIFYEEQDFPKTVMRPELHSFRGLFHATNSAFRRDIFKSIRFDESFKYDYDFDACWRLLLKGHQLAYNPKMKVSYIFPAAISDILRRYYVWGFEFAKLTKKHSHGANMVRFVRSYYRVIRFLMEPKPLLSVKKLLRFVQHVAFNAGYLGGFIGFDRSHS